jgi:hypothetical protein
MTTAIPRIATSELVALAWIGTVIEPYAIASGTTLQGPDPTTSILSWGDTGFVQVAAVGGQPHVHLPLRRPVLSIDCWATNVGRKRPPWGRANVVAELIVAATYSVGAHGTANDAQRPVTLPSDYGTAIVRGAVVRSEPRRRPSDVAEYAHYGFELEIDWLAL